MEAEYARVLWLKHFFVKNVLCILKKKIRLIGLGRKRGEDKWREKDEQTKKIKLVKIIGIKIIRVDISPTGAVGLFVGFAIMFIMWGVFDIPYGFLLEMLLIFFIVIIQLCEDKKTKRIATDDWGDKKDEKNNMYFDFVVICNGDVIVNTKRNRNYSYKYNM